MLSSLLALSAVFGTALAAAQSNSSVVCVAGQCLQGFTNTTIGMTLSAPGLGSDVLLLPGQYTSTTNPDLLHQLLTSSSTTASSSPGFNGSISSLPLTVALEPGFAAFTESLYSGQSQFAPIPSARPNSSVSFSAGSLALAANTWVALTSGSAQDRVIIWNSIPDVAQVPSLGSLAVVDIQSSSCSPQCSGSSVCSASGQCVCPAGFTGASCETCAKGFFGPKCEACPAGCTSCDEGITGSGRCLVPIVTNPPSACNCLNGECGTNGQCTCNAGWTTADNGTSCAKCAIGFFLDSNGDCSKCQLGCDQCADQSGICVSCKTGFTQDANDRTKCNAAQSVTNTGTQCPDGSFSNGTACAACSASCQTCSGGTSNDCIICGNGQFALNGSCVPTDSNGVCTGSTLVANNNKHECDGCPAKCTTCNIPNFNVASTFDQLKCTGCLPGFVLANGQCVENCPSGTFLDPKDNPTCTACSSTCGTCVGAADFCLTCANNQLASSGQCVSSCPSGTVSSASSCLACHPDCASCSGTNFNQCTACPADRPVLSNGRCLPTCSQNQFFDKTSSSCQSCDSSCASCTGSGPSACLACSSANQVLRGGSCTAANCNGTTTGVVSGLGVCLSELVIVPQATVSGSASASLPSITGISEPTKDTEGSGNKLAWWQILLMALGCAFIFMTVLWLVRRRMRRKRAQQTAAFAASRGIQPGSWRFRLLRFGERLFGHKPSRIVDPRQEEELKMMKLRNAEEERHAQTMGKLGGSSHLPSYYDRPPSPDSRRISSNYSDSIYSQITGVPRKGPQPRQPVKTMQPMASRFSWTTAGTSSRRQPPPPVIPQTEAQRYAHSMRTLTPSPEEEARGTYWLKPSPTGGSSESKNPFRR
ncbi:insulin-like growth factor binding protein [Amylostereum chailletii]|nr:insulin-like growth factor binding protein [Amylostereum chailletii]